MEKMKKLLGVYKLNARKICMLGMLTALTAVLGMYCTIRIGAGIKISFKFVSVFMVASMFGPVWGGVACVISDILAFSKDGKGRAKKGEGKAFGRQVSLAIRGSGGRDAWSGEHQLALLFPF